MIASLMASSTSPVVAALADLRTALDELGLRWFVFGAQAAILYGSTRLTADVDVTVELGDLPPRRLVQAAKRRGFAAQIPSPDFIAVTRVIPLVHVTTRLPVDIVLAGPGLEDLFLERANTLRVGGTRIPVASVEDLIVMKVLAGRPKDMEDIDAILSASRELDVAQIRNTLALAESALDQSDLSAAFESRLGRHRLAKRRAKKTTKTTPTTKRATPSKPTAGSNSKLAPAKRSERAKAKRVTKRAGAKGSKR